MSFSSSNSRIEISVILLKVIQLPINNMAIAAIKPIKNLQFRFACMIHTNSAAQIARSWKP